MLWSADHTYGFSAASLAGTGQKQHGLAPYGRARKPWSRSTARGHILHKSMALLGAAIQHTQQDCRETVDLEGLALAIDGARHEFRPLIREVECLRCASLPNPEDRD